VDAVLRTSICLQEGKVLYVYTTRKADNYVVSCVTWAHVTIWAERIVLELTCAGGCRALREEKEESGRLDCSGRWRLGTKRQCGEVASPLRMWRPPGAGHVTSAWRSSTRAVEPHSTAFASCSLATTIAPPPCPDVRLRTARHSPGRRLLSRPFARSALLSEMMLGALRAAAQER
jgi:hypothetical protein